MSLPAPEFCFSPPLHVIQDLPCPHTLPSYCMVATIFGSPLQKPSFLLLPSLELSLRPSLCSDLLDRGRSLASVISVFACSIWSSSFFIGVQEVFIGQTDAERPMSLATFQLCVFPASPPLESLPQQRHWKRSDFFQLRV